MKQSLEDQVPLEDKRTVETIKAEKVPKATLSQKIGYRPIVGSN